MALMLAKEQPKARKTEGPSWPGSTGDQGPALPSPACLQNATNPRRPDPWTRERSRTASRLTDVHGQPQPCASRRVRRSRQPHARPTCLARRTYTAAPATKSRSYCRVGRASLFGGRSLTGRGSFPRPHPLVFIFRQGVGRPALGTVDLPGLGDFYLVRLCPT